MLLEPPQPAHSRCLLLLWSGPPGETGDFARQENPFSGRGGFTLMVGETGQGEGG